MGNYLDFFFFLTNKLKQMNIPSVPREVLAVFVAEAEGIGDQSFGDCAREAQVRDAERRT